ncbi:MMPL family transporter [Actinokineospora sp. PR83]|uniref:MMPL family transporter n=1 Tax=Actinokineospora sp. PR83 TaxID=2884908 RepID=UPI001F371D64|nr:MMPL family transporter [Actinokineospora sp. PR83]MCG8917336.1 MMPL family transporter [Actinokineospora sp. PR83]
MSKSSGAFLRQSRNVDAVPPAWWKQTRVGRWLGLGLSIDFSLLIVSRFREELAQSHSTADALRRTVNIAGRTVAFSSPTVAAALATLTIFPRSYLRSTGLAGVMTVVSAAVFALLVLPALGHRVNSLAPKPWQRGAERADEQGRWYRVATAVMRRGGLFTALSVLILLFALAFGLSTDYTPFLLGRVEEARDNGVGDREAVALGIERTGRMGTSAAVLFCIAVGALMFSRITLIAELGFGATLAVLIDATIVRAMLVPSLMGLLGEFAW